MKPSFYLAASFVHKASAREYADKLVAQGHRCTARWLYDSADEEGIQEGKLPKDSVRFARQDLADIEDANALVLFSGPEASWGKATGAGYAMAFGRPVYPVGHAQVPSVFATLWRERATPQEFLADPFPGFVEDTSCILD